MNLYLSKAWEFLRSSFWFIPGLIALTFILISIISLYVDEMFNKSQWIDAISLWHGGADGAQQVLSGVAGAFITLMSIVFSVATVPLSVAATQYGSRIIRNFMRDFGTQLVLGFSSGTAVYSLLVLRTIRTEPNPFVPKLSITLSLLFTIASLALLIYFIHHISVRIQAPEIIGEVARDLTQTINCPLPGQIIPKDQEKKISQQADEIIESTASYSIASCKSGYIQTINYDSLLQIAVDNDLFLDVPHRASYFIKEDQALVLAYSSKPLDEQTEKAIKKAFIIGKERVALQDIEYNIDQLETIAARALTEDVRDAFNVNLCIDYLGDNLARLFKKEIPSQFILDKSNKLRLKIKQIRYQGLVDSAFNQIRQFGKGNASVIIHLLDTFASIVPFIQTEDQREAIKKHALMIKRLGDELPEVEDRKDMEERFNIVQEKLGLLKDSLSQKS